MTLAVLLVLLLQISDYQQLNTVAIAANLNARTNQTLGANVFNTCINDPAISLDGDLWFEPWPSQSYRVQVWYSNGTTDQADVDGFSSSSGLSAVYLGETGEDLVGPNNQTSANGTLDRHIQLRGLASNPVRVQITGTDQPGLWEAPYNGSNWSIAVTYGKNATVVAHCNSRAIYEMTKDCVARYAAYYAELIKGSVRSKSKEAERLRFYRLELIPTGAPGITIP